MQAYIYNFAKPTLAERTRDRGRREEEHPGKVMAEFKPFTDEIVTVAIPDNVNALVLDADKWSNGSMDQLKCKIISRYGR